MATKKNKKLTVSKLHDALTKEGYLCERDFTAKVTTSIVTKPTAGSFLFGPAGTGKTYLPVALAKIMGAQEVFYQCFPGTREDDLLVKMLPDEETKSGIKLFDGPLLKAIHMSNNGDGETPIFLTLDEWDKTRPSADSFLLDFLQNGRVTFQGEEHVANLERLYVFVTMNDERDLSEPLLRRMPIIEFEHLAPALVYEALKLTHADSKHLDSAIMLYERCVLADMNKPATIQELRQLLDAIEVLGKDADWDDLVFQYVTKTQENHMLLKLSEEKEVTWERKKKSEEEALEEGAYEVSDEEAERLRTTEKTERKARMPRMHEVREFDMEWEGKDATEDVQTYGILRRTSKDYDRIVHLVTDPNDHAGDLGDEDSLVVANVSEEDIRLVKPLPLIQHHEVKDLFHAEGEVMFIEPLATYGDVKRLAKNTDMEIVKYSNGEMIARAEGIHLRCTKELGAEIIVDLDAYHVFAEIFGAEVLVDDGRDKWISGRTMNVDDLENAVIVNPSDYGIMYRKHYLRGVQGYNKALIKNRYDVWGDGWDTIADEDIPLLEDFHKEDYRILQSGRENERFYMTDNIVFGFFGADNDMFGLKILGCFDKKFYKYVNAWVPDEGVEVRLSEIIDAPHKAEKYIKDFGYSFAKDNKAVIEKKFKSGLKVSYDTNTGCIEMNADMSKKKMTYNKLNALLTDMEAVWGEFTNVG